MIEEKEIWKDICEGLYKVSNYGKCFSYRRNKLIGSKDKRGYVKIGLTRKKTTYLHRLVYETFIGQIPEGMEVNHKDENPSNNCVWNLNLLTHKDNIKYKTAQQRRIENCKSKKNRMKPVIQYTKDGQFVAEYPSIAEAYRQTGIAKVSISDCCINKIDIDRDGYQYIHRTAGGYVWKYKKIA